MSSKVLLEKLTVANLLNIFSVFHRTVFTRANKFYKHMQRLVTRLSDVIGGVMFSVLASGLKVRGFKPGRDV
jgi:hypothetical protein